VDILITGSRPIKLMQTQTSYAVSGYKRRKPRLSFHCRLNSTCLVSGVIGQVPPSTHRGGFSSIRNRTDDP
jgi:hypothetical protein